MSNISLHADVREISNPGHYPNMKKHIFRTAKKYEDIHFFVKRLADDEINHKTAHHIIIDSRIKDQYIEEDDEIIIENLELIFENMRTKIQVYAASIVSGENESHRYITPCLHILGLLPVKIEDGTKFIVNLLTKQK